MEKVPGGWDLGLRDGSLEIWSQPRKSKALNKLYAERTKLDGTVRGPKLHSKEAVAFHAAEAIEVQKLTAICQKDPTARKSDEIKLTQNFMRQFPFFQLWPDGVQRHLASVMATEVRVRHETIISRGTPQTRIFFVISGRVRVSIPSGSTRRGGAGPLSQPADGPPGGGEGSRTLATLKKGDTCGEAALLGPSPSHADVVVDSPAATVLSLSQADFMRALKGVLGLRHQDRLMYLRVHPLFVDVSLEDLDRASDLFKLDFYPPGTQLYPHHRKKEPANVYLMAEGQCCVKRKGRHGVTPVTQQDGDWVPPAYDGNTASMLGPLDAFGLEPVDGSRVQSSEPGGGGGGWVVETVSQVKAYHVTQEKFRMLPISMQKAIEGACDFKEIYLRGRIQGLAKLDVARKAPTYGAVTYKIGEIEMTSLTVMEAPPASPRMTNNMSFRAGKSSATANSALSNRLLPTLNNLAAREAMELLQAEAVKDAAHRAGLSPERLMDREDGSDSSYKTVSRNASPTQSTDLGHPPTTRLLRDRQGLLGSRGHSSGTQLGGIQSVKPQRGTGFSGPKLGSLPPTSSTWSRLATAKRETIFNEAPRPQPVPQTLVQRHLAMFRAAKHASTGTRCRVSMGFGPDNESDDELVGTHTSGYYNTRSQSRRLSARLRDGRRSGPSTPSWSANGVYDPAARHSGSLPPPPWSPPSGNRDTGADASSTCSRNPMSSPTTEAGLQLPASSGYFTSQAKNPLSPPSSHFRVSSSGSGPNPIQAGIASEGFDQNSRNKAEAVVYAECSGSELSGEKEPSLNQTLKPRGPSSSTSSHAARGLNWELEAGSATDDAEQHQQQQQQQHQHQQQIPRGSEAQDLHHQPTGPHGPHIHFPNDKPMSTESDILLLPGNIQGKREAGSGGKKAAPSTRSPATSPPKKSERRTPSPKKTKVQGRRNSESIRRRNLDASQRRISEAEGTTHSSVGEAVTGLPPSVVLGYESLDPFQWAALMSYASPDMRKSNDTQDNVLPKPKW
ncbi:hypothetical protein CEUSTIGMA_g3699.t1 [Chlamydomonas eustigma]|uniref:Cyclic nucleotide-binding domain-containing protein n=1 Tax=Chlamydomonas eustigma TaxID=1157962 RepID=A0A250WZP4_9CHLO|nr:hypothetical protein CEUSTIGMA_g3699.t1 [Chlamydomonas eustigma]|eukprot:GAX76255.1 hypothetical protein CEUSTIGMA_g3699.t1 [Chlamydomonas eustigma]